MRDTYIVGNWKMNQSLSSINEFFTEIQTLKLSTNVHGWIAPQAMHLSTCINLGAKLGIKIGSQTCSEFDDGAYTGELSCSSLKDLGVHFTLVGHSERRTIFDESHKVLNEKTKKALTNDLICIFCVGETLEQREADQTFKVVEEQIIQGLKDCTQDNILIAYEPVWAIGTGKTATPEQANEVHGFIRNLVQEKLGWDGEKQIILYGGSVKPANIAELLSCEHIDGGLVGGASLKSSDFKQLTEASQS